MKNAAWGGVLSSILVLAALAGWNSLGEAWAAKVAEADLGVGRELVSFSSPIDDHRQQVTVIDPRMRVMSVYHIHRDTGEIALKSVRNITWDLQMDEFNSVNPLPREIRSLLEQK